jgi:hypothetical protein
VIGRDGQRACAIKATASIVAATKANGKTGKSADWHAADRTGTETGPCGTNNAGSDLVSNDRGSTPRYELPIPFRAVGCRAAAASGHSGDNSVFGGVIARDAIDDFLFRFFSPDPTMGRTHLPGSILVVAKNCSICRIEISAGLARLHVPVARQQPISTASASRRRLLHLPFQHPEQAAANDHASNQREQRQRGTSADPVVDSVTECSHSCTDSIASTEIDEDGAVAIDFVFHRIGASEFR